MSNAVGRNVQAFDAAATASKQGPPASSFGRRDQPGYRYASYGGQRSNVAVRAPASKIFSIFALQIAVFSPTSSCDINFFSVLILLQCDNEYQA
jgi:hypothetical protein